MVRRRALRVRADGVGLLTLAALVAALRAFGSVAFDGSCAFGVPHAHANNARAGRHRQAQGRTVATHAGSSWSFMKMFGITDPEDDAKEKLMKLASSAEEEVAIGVVSLQSGREALAKAEAALLPMPASVDSAVDEAMVQAEKGWEEDEAQWDQSLQKLADHVMVKVKATEAAAKAVEDAAAALAATCKEVEVNATVRTEAAKKVVESLDAAVQANLKEHMTVAAKSLVDSDILPFWAFGKAEATDSHRIVRTTAPQVDVAGMIKDMRAKREKLKEAAQAAAAEKAAAEAAAAEAAREAAEAEAAAAAEAERRKAEADQRDTLGGVFVFAILLAAAAYYVSTDGNSGSFSLPSSQLLTAKVDELSSSLKQIIIPAK